MFEEKKRPMPGIYANQADQTDDKVDVKTLTVVSGSLEVGKFTKALFQIDSCWLMVAACRLQPGGASFKDDAKCVLL